MVLFLAGFHTVRQYRLWQEWMWRYPSSVPKDWRATDITQAHVRLQGVG
jgi:hypothetical protein